MTTAIAAATAMEDMVITVVIEAIADKTATPKNY